MTFRTLDELRDACRDLPVPDHDAMQRATERQGVLTKPVGSLGRLEEIAIWMAGWQGLDSPRLDRASILLFAGNHGVVAQGVSLYPASVTAQMVENFRSGGAAINQLARVAGASLDVIALDLDTPTDDFTQGPAMSDAAFLDAVNRGYAAVTRDTQLLALGEMGIGNTTAAAALCAALLGDNRDWAGRGTGVDDTGLSRKRDAIARGLARHQAILHDPLAVAAALGGRELAAMAGAALAARHARIPMLLDGFVATAAMLPLVRLNPDVLAHCKSAHVSAEAGHRALLEALNLKPLLDLEMRLGEASGAALAIPLVRAALACHAGMATFASAAVSGPEA